MHQTLQGVNKSTVSGLGRLARFFGFSEVMGRLYGTLLLSPGPMSLDDLMESLQITWNAGVWRARCGYEETGASSIRLNQISGR
jgi:hypothetical protein